MLLGPRTVDVLELLAGDTWEELKILLKTAFGTRNKQLSKLQVLCNLEHGELTLRELAQEVQASDWPKWCSGVENWRSYSIKLSRSS